MRETNDYLRGLAAVDAKFLTTRFNVAELWVGVEKARDREREQEVVEELLCDLEILEFDEIAAQTFGRVTAHLQAIGRPIGDMDALVASVALANDQSLVTRNPKHFADIPGLELRTY